MNTYSEFTRVRTLPRRFALGDGLWPLEGWNTADFQDVGVSCERRRETCGAWTMGTFDCIFTFSTI